MTIIQGDLIKLALEGRFDVVVHGCNCFCTMGAGIAKGIRAAFPKTYEADCATKKGDRKKLGTCSFAECPTPSGTVTVVNAYTQYRYAGGGVLVEYDAVRRCLKWIAEKFPDRRIGLPKIGAGLAGGNWEVIQRIVAEQMAGADVTIVEYDI